MSTPYYQDESVTLSAPFPWFGGKSRVAPEVWERFGDVDNFVEPFFGSGAVLLGRPTRHRGRVETVNDLDGFVANFWRAVADEPDAVAYHADWPVIEADLNARHAYLVGIRGDLLAHLEGNPYHYDARIAGWWVAGLCGWIGSGYCSGNGPWVVRDERLVNARDLSNAGQGINRQMPHLSNAGQGINRQMPHLGDAGRGEFIRSWMRDLSARLRNVRVLSGDWKRCLTESVTTRHGMTGVFLDPPYGDEIKQTRVYATDSGTVSDEVRAWCIENGYNSQLRIALCGYAGEGHDELEDHGWTSHAWSTSGGYGGGRGGVGDVNRHRERIYFSPACIDLSPAQGVLDLGEDTA